MKRITLIIFFALVAVAAINAAISAPDVPQAISSANVTIGNQQIIHSNSHWLNFLLALLPTGSIMFVVGAGPVGRGRNISSALHNNRYKVTPIQPVTL